MLSMYNVSFFLLLIDHKPFNCRVGSNCYSKLFHCKGECWTLFKADLQYLSYPSVNAQGGIDLKKKNMEPVKCGKSEHHKRHTGSRPVTDFPVKPGSIASFEYVTWITQRRLLEQVIFCYIFFFGKLNCGTLSSGSYWAPFTRAFRPACQFFRQT